MSHTAGPWRFSQDGGEPYWSVDMPLCGGDGYGSGNAMVYTSESDARLIAAAPDLLAAAKLVLEAGDQEYVKFIVRDAISKAEGRE